MPQHDGGRVHDWSRASDDYALYRPGYPPSFWQFLALLGVGLRGQRIVDLGTGTGVLARGLAARGCDVTGVDIAAGQLAAAQRLAEAEGLAIDFRQAPAENTGLPARSFDFATAGQSWLYFDLEPAVDELKRLLVPGGSLVASYLSWMPREDDVAEATERLVLQYNPDWSHADYAGGLPSAQAWRPDLFRIRAQVVYEEPLTFTHETWRGRIRACRAIGATLPAEQVAAFDAELAARLCEWTPSPFTVLHQIVATVLQPS